MLTKFTNAWECVSKHSVIPDRYKTRVIKMILSRAYVISSILNAFHTEIDRLQRMFTNINFPVKQTCNTIKQVLANEMSSRNELTNTTNKKLFYYPSQMSQQYNQEEKNLSNIINNNFISPRHDRGAHTLFAYDKNTLHRQLLKKKKHPPRHKQ